MRIYPAIRARMGDWPYYILRMKMREIANHVQFAFDVYQDTTLSHAARRALDGNPVRADIAGYLGCRSDRFISSIVVTAADGEPTWTPVEMDSEAVPPLLACSNTMRESFGLLSFGNLPKYHVLDGQHRVAAIKLLVNGDAGVEAPQGFDDDLLSVIVLLREEHDVPEGEWMNRCRRLFSSLNRHAKPTDRDTNIIMDEDDLFAIVTHRLITEYEFFQAPGPERDSFKVLTKGRNLKSGVSHFTTLQILYDANEILLRTRARQVHGWSAGGTQIDKQTRPEEEEIDKYHEELERYWNAILRVLPILREPPQKMRTHEIPEPNDEQYQDHLLFWPIGQLLFARLVRGMLNHAFPDGSFVETDRLAEALHPLAQIPWELHEAPWHYLLLVPKPEDQSWRMRSEDRKETLEYAFRLLCWIVGLDPLNEQETHELKAEWQNLLLRPPVEKSSIEEMWQQVVDVRARIVGAA